MILRHMKMIRTKGLDKYQLHAGCARCGGRTLLQCTDCDMPFCSLHASAHLCMPGQWTVEARIECGAHII